MSAEESAPYGQSPAAPPEAVPAPPSRIRTHHLAKAKEAGQRFAMVTAYDQYMAGIFDEAGIEVLLVGDSAANNVLGHETTLPITLDEMVMFSRAVTAGSRRALVVADLPFGSYQVSPGQAVESAVRLMKEARVHAVKLEGGAHFADHVRAITRAGIPVMGHVGFTPQSEHALGGYRVQGRGAAARAVLEDALAIEAAGAFSVLMEMVPAETAAEVDRALKVPTVGIGAGAGTTGQVLVWQDMLGLGQGKVPRFVKRYADLRSIVSGAARAYRDDVLAGTFPGAEHSF
ncbi:3-methyl-2-oxobutanoate hydroxymethyltransferase [Zafaria cholistanensis]|uniref:3-methyl-2-oxobutanoate hydroxymethyltransferase n=1 Tax=Zafaria cholistanensis TaxID=1682741 RepID=A0A5A7NVX0_9MICC|nr:3-methyl-2-oxobutanoate hydroxymethyltransferase [Zafaria cholistanensis]GER24391.1 3-methyl-2-oxobutanoate hydroxymethyltransferase [Zafaria cholistanensis]